MTNTNSPLGTRIASLSPARQRLLVRQLADHIERSGTARQSLTAFIRPEKAGSTPDVTTYLRERLPSYMVPSQVVFVDDLPRTPNGKLDRRPLEELAVRSLQPQHTSQVHYENRTEAELARVWKEILELDSIRRDDNYFDIGGTSLLAVRLYARIKEELFVQLPISSMMNAPTIAQQAALIVEQFALANTALVKLKNGDPEQPPFILLHGQGGVLLAYRHIVRFLPDWMPVYGIQAPGLQGEEKPYRDVVKMAARYLQEIKKVQPHGPYYLMGFSGGGMTAYEMARQLKAAGESVGGLVLLDPILEWTPQVNPPPSRSQRMVTALKLWLMSGGVQEKVTFLTKKFVLRWNLHVKGQSPSQQAMKEDAPQWERYQQATRDAHLAAYMSYAPQPYEGDAVYVWPVSNGFIEPHKEWEKVIRGSLKLIKIDGDHVSAIMEENAELIAGLMVEQYMNRQSMLVTTAEPALDRITHD